MLVLAEGCDFFRSLAGRPTSEEIERKRAILEARQSVTMEDSTAVEAAQPEEKAAVPDEDSLAVMRAIEARPALLSTSSRLSASTRKSIPSYCVIVGAFGNADNARKLASGLEKAGYKCVLLPYTSGMTAVGVDPTGSIVKAYGTLCGLVDAGLAPEDSWILDNR